MSTRTMLAVVFIFSLLGMGAGIWYAISTNDGIPAFLAVIVGLSVLGVVVAMNSDLE